MHSEVQIRIGVRPLKEVARAQSPSRSLKNRLCRLEDSQVTHYVYYQNGIAGAKDRLDD